MPQGRALGWAEPGGQLLGTPPKCYEDWWGQQDPAQDGAFTSPSLTMATLYVLPPLSLVSARCGAPCTSSHGSSVAMGTQVHLFWFLGHRKVHPKLCVTQTLHWLRPRTCCCPQLG